MELVGLPIAAPKAGETVTVRLIGGRLTEHHPYPPPREELWLRGTGG